MHRKHKWKTALHPHEEGERRVQTADSVDACIVDVVLPLAQVEVSAEADLHITIEVEECEVKLPINPRAEEIARVIHTDRLLRPIGKHSTDIEAVFIFGVFGVRHVLVLLASGGIDKDRHDAAITGLLEFPYLCWDRGGDRNKAHCCSVH